MVAWVDMHDYHVTLDALESLVVQCLFELTKLNVSGTGECYALSRLDPGFGFGGGVPESGVGWDGASASGSLRRLDFHVWYLVMGRGHVAGCDNEAVDSNGGDVHEQESRCGGG